MYVFFDFKTLYGFEIACNLLLDDGNELKDMRRVLLSQKLSTVCAFHEQHITGPMITYIVVTSEEISKTEFQEIMRKKENKADGDSSSHVLTTATHETKEPEQTQEEDDYSFRDLKQSPEKVTAKTPIYGKLNFGNPHSFHNALNIERRATGVHQSYNTDRDGLT